MKTDPKKNNNIIPRIMVKFGDIKTKELLMETHLKNTEKLKAALFTEFEKYV